MYSQEQYTPPPPSPAPPTQQYYPPPVYQQQAQQYAAAPQQWPPPQQPVGMYPPPPPKKSKTGLYAAVGAIVIAVILIAVVIVVIHPFGGSSNQAPNQAVSYSQAAGSASSLSATESGSWTMILAGGIDAAQIPAGGATSSSCPNSGITLLPTFNGNMNSGQSPAWLFFYKSTSTTSVMLITVIDGKASLGFISTDPNCVSGYSGNGIPSNVMDSPQAASIAWSDGGQGFMKTYPNDFLLMVLVSISSGTAWGFEYEQCFGLTSGNTVPTYSIIVDAFSGSVLQSQQGTQYC